MNKKQAHRLKFDAQRISQATFNRLIILGVASALIAIVIFVVGLLLFPATAHLPGSPATPNWGTLGDFTSLMTLALIVGGGVFVFLEHINNEIHHRRESAEASYNIYKDIFERFTNEEETAARRWIIMNIEPLGDSQNKDEWLKQTKAKILERPKNWNDEQTPGQTCLKRVLNTFDFIGFVAVEYWNLENELVGWLSPPVAKVWERIGPYIEHEADKRKETDYYKSARELGDECIQWRRDHGLDSTFYKDAT